MDFCDSDDFVSGDYADCSTYKESNDKMADKKERVIQKKLKKLQSIVLS